MKINTLSNSGTEYKSNGKVIIVQAIMGTGAAAIEAKVSGNGLEASGFTPIFTFSADEWKEIQLPNSCVYRYVITGNAEISEA
jgi:hypothetical protein